MFILTAWLAAAPPRANAQAGEQDPPVEAQDASAVAPAHLPPLAISPMEGFRAPSPRMGEMSRSKKMETPPVSPGPVSSRDKVDLSQRAEPLKPGEKVNLDFNDVDIRLLIKFIAEITGKNFVVDEKVKGKVTIISPQMVTAGEALKTLESTLEVYGYSLIEAGRMTKVVPAMDARLKGSFKAGLSEAGDRMITRLAPLSHIKADEIVNTIRPLIPAYSFIGVFASTNTVIIVDYASNVEKLMAIIAQMDTPTHEEVISLFQLKYAGAKEIAEKVEKIFKGRSAGRGVVSSTTAATAGAAPLAAQPGAQFGGQQDVLVIPDDRINAIVVTANKAVTGQILSLIEKLDVRPPSGKGNINVRYLKNGDAESLSKVLMNLTQTTQAGAQPATGRAGAPGQAVKFQDKITITPDKATNSLVITASVEDFETLDQVIEKLDIRRKQVFVEALIMEVTTDKAKQFGIEWRTTSNFTQPGVQGIGGTNFGNINNVAQNPLNSPLGLAVGVVDGIISFGGKDFLNIGALLHALESEQGINVLSTPNIMTTDNEEAEIIVARNVPFQTSQSQTTGGNTVSTFDRKNIGITLKIKPQISESDDVRLAVYQEISSVLPVEEQMAKDIMTFTRSIKTTVLVRDAQNIVIGGLISDDMRDTEIKVPILGDLPILGWLFKSMKKQKTKTNLLVFITPHIITRAEDMDKITSAKSQKISMAPEVRDDFGGAVLDTRKEEAGSAATSPKQVN
jgi:general secretion pathway protein D